METTINQRFKKFLDEKNIRQNVFSEMTGLDEKTVSNIARGNTEQPKSSFFEAIARHYPELNLRWLLLGDGEMLVSDAQGSDVVREPAAIYDRGGGKETNTDKLIETVHNLALMVNELPAMREKIKRMEEELTELKKSKLK